MMLDSMLSTDDKRLCVIRCAANVPAEAHPNDGAPFKNLIGEHNIDKINFIVKGADLLTT